MIKQIKVKELKELLSNYNDEDVVELEVITQDYADAYLTIGDEIILEILM